MRLLSSTTWEIKDFISADAIPPYAIVSHTWGDDEVSFQDWQTASSREVESKQGYKKIQYCCEQAVADEIGWIWMDTCCIDKTSSAELSEAINSMFRWYQASIVCYVYLSDMPRSVNQSAMKSKLAQSRWFSRGWTLQELLAPDNVIFYSKDWHKLGTKSSLKDIISSVTNIESAFLDGRCLENASVSKKMSWAANRQTSRPEDIAYCLLGIFDVHVPLLYGEGKKSFRRLQLEIMRTYPHDHTLFAWGVIGGIPPAAITDNAVLDGTKKITWSSHMVQEVFLGLLAQSPKDFEFSGSLQPLSDASAFYQDGDLIPVLPREIGKAIRLDLPITPFGPKWSLYHWSQAPVAQLRSMATALLLCHDETKNDSLIGLPLYPWGYMCWGRTRQLTVVPHDITLYHLKRLVRCLCIEPMQPISLESGDFVCRRHTSNGTIWVNNIDTPTGSRLIFHENIVKVTSIQNGHFAYVYRLQEPFPTKGFFVKFSRVLHGRSSRPRVSVGLIPAMWPAPNSTSPPWINEDGIRWINQSTRNLADAVPLYAKVMGDSGGILIIDSEPFPRVRIQVERMELDQDGSFFDVIEIHVLDKPGIPPLSRSLPVYSTRDRKVKRRKVDENTERI